MVAFFCRAATPHVDPIRLSRRHVALLTGREPVPPVRGIRNWKSAPMLARLAAKQQKAAAWRYYAIQQREITLNQLEWTEDVGADHVREWREIEEDWAHAHRISDESGFEYTDRWGDKQNVGGRPTSLQKSLMCIFVCILVPSSN